MDIIYPMFALVLLTLLVGFSLGISRVRAAFSGQVDPAYYRLFRGAVPPEKLEQLSRNFSNLFEVPVLFYVFGILCLVTGTESKLILGLSWIYVALRCVHTAIHISYNHPLHRFFAFLASVVVVTALWILLLVNLQAV